MMSSPARSMSRMAVSAASSNISSRSAGPNWPASCAFTAAYHPPPLPWEATPGGGIRGSSAGGGADLAGLVRLHGGVPPAALAMGADDGGGNQGQLSHRSCPFLVYDRRRDRRRGARAHPLHRRARQRRRRARASRPPLLTPPPTS